MANKRRKPLEIPKGIISNGHGVIGNLVIEPSGKVYVKQEKSRSQRRKRQQ